VHREPWLGITAGATAIGTVVLFFLSQPLFDWAAQALLKIF
jgi:hypothetical protein